MNNNFFIILLILILFFSSNKNLPKIAIAYYQNKPNYPNVYKITKKLYHNTEIFKKNRVYDILYTNSNLIPKIIKYSKINWIYYNKIINLTDKSKFTKYIFNNKLQKYYPDTILIGYNDKLIDKFKKKYKYFFIKKNLDAKKGLRIVKNINVEKDDVIIQPVIELNLLYGHRYVIRSYWLIKNSKMFLFKDGKLRFCPKKYYSNPLDLKTVINYSLTKKEQNAQKNFISLMSQMKNYNSLLKQLKMFSKKFYKNNKFIRKHKKFSKYNQFALIGLDIAVTKNNKIIIFEINMNPGVPQRNELTSKLENDMFESMYNIIMYNNDINNCFTYIE